MKAALVVLLLFTCSCLWSQEPSKTGALAVREQEEVFVVCDLEAQFPGENSALIKFLAANINFPTTSGEIYVSGKVFVQFVVSAEGKVVSPEIKRGIPDCPECDAEVLRVVKLLPDFIPAKIQGKPVNSYFNLPVRFCHYECDEIPANGFYQESIAAKTKYRSTFRPTGILRTVNYS